MASDSSEARVSAPAKRLADPAVWHRSRGEVCLGCVQCPEREICGGLSVEAQVFSCMDFCCQRPDSCKQHACPADPMRYSKLVNEIGGLQLDPYRRRIHQPRQFPSYAPCILDRSRFQGPLHLPVVALPLFKIMNLKTGLARFKSRQELLAYYGIHESARLILFATGRDNLVERFYTRLRPRTTAESIRSLEPDLLTTPNFSLHCRVPRHDNMVSMKRIVYCFEAFANAGLPVALHVNGRTPRDFERWTKYVRQSPYIRNVTYELGTAGGSSVRRPWHVDQLIQFARDVGRPLVLFLRSGGQFLPELRSAFHHVVFMDVTPFIKTRKRREANVAASKLAWKATRTEQGAPLDSLFLHNVRARSAMLSRSVRRKAVQQSVTQDQVPAS